jgi:FkbM family methyltransferase
VKGVLFKFIPAPIYKILELFNYFIDGYSKKSYSQEGEDMILRRLFEGQKTGTFVDVGAHHPMRFSNTLYFYKRGWRGINIEPNPEMIGLFKILRKRDINVQCGISAKEDKLTYIQFDDPALNTFDRHLANERVQKTSYKIIGETEIPVRQLKEVLKQNLSPGQSIDFLTIDAEGYDLAVLESNDWEKYRPELILVEELESYGLDREKIGKVEQFLSEKGYNIFAKTLNTLFFKDNNKK